MFSMVSMIDPNSTCLRYDLLNGTYKVIIEFLEKITMIRLVLVVT